MHGLNYFIPCHVKDRVIAYIGLGRTENGDYLTSEDIDLLGEALVAGESPCQRGVAHDGKVPRGRNGFVVAGPLVRIGEDVPGHVELGSGGPVGGALLLGDLVRRVGGQFGGLGIVAHGVGLAGDEEQVAGLGGGGGTTEDTESTE